MFASFRVSARIIRSLPGSSPLPWLAWLDKTSFFYFIKWLILSQRAELDPDPIDIAKEHRNLDNIITLEGMLLRPFLDNKFGIDVEVSHL